MYRLHSTIHNLYAKYSIDIKKRTMNFLFLLKELFLNEFNYNYIYMKIKKFIPSVLGQDSIL